MNDRETKFRKFAELLQDELIAACDADYGYEGIVTIIAQRAYDLARHVLSQEFAQARPFVTGQFVQMELDRISDLTQWPPTE